MLVIVYITIIDYREVKGYLIILFLSSTHFVSENGTPSVSNMGLLKGQSCGEGDAAGATWRGRRRRGPASFQRGGEHATERTEQDSY